MKYSKYRKKTKGRRTKNRRRKKYKKSMRAKKRRMGRLQRAGEIFYDRPFYISIYDIYNRENGLLEKNFEVCGQGIQESEAHKTQLVCIAKGSVKENMVPASCNTGQNYPVVWHTHPNVSKMYPSLVDIFKIVKHSSHTSYIFTRYGYWLLTYEDKDENFDSRLANPLVATIKADLDNFYHETGKGMQYNADAITYLVNNINAAMEEHGMAGYRIQWYDVNDNNLSVFN